MENNLKLKKEAKFQFQEFPKNFYSCCQIERISNYVLLKKSFSLIYKEPQLIENEVNEKFSGKKNFFKLCIRSKSLFWTKVDDQSDIFSHANFIRESLFYALLIPWSILAIYFFFTQKYFFGVFKRKLSNISLLLQILKINKESVL